MTTDEWCRVFREAHELGVVQLGLSGGEPTLRPDLTELVRCAKQLGLYSTLVTSAYRLRRERLAGLKEAGLDHVQISIQAADAELSDRIAGTDAYQDKLAAYRDARVRAVVTTRVGPAATGSSTASTSTPSVAPAA